MLPLTINLPENTALFALQHAWHENRCLSTLWISSQYMLNLFYSTPSGFHYAWTRCLPAQTQQSLLLVTAHQIYASPEGLAPNEVCHHFQQCTQLQFLPASESILTAAAPSAPQVKNASETALTRDGMSRTDRDACGIGYSIIHCALVHRVSPGRSHASVRKAVCR